MKAYLLEGGQNVRARLGGPSSPFAAPSIADVRTRTVTGTRGVIVDWPEASKPLRKLRGRNEGEHGREDTDPLPRGRRAFRRLIIKLPTLPATIATSEDLVQARLAHVFKKVGAFLF